MFLAINGMVLRFFLLVLICTSYDAFSQSDSAKGKISDDTSKYISQPVVPGNQIPQQQRIEFRDDNVEGVTAQEIPPALKKTLTAEEYRGWENGTIHRNLQTSEYKVEVASGEEKKVFYFDRNGSRIMH
jgi:hypothetical protein